MSARVEAWLWFVQRATAALLALAILVHLATILYAVRVGLTAEAILGRLRGNVAWYVFYIVFATAAGTHAGIGVRTILREHTGWQGRSLDIAVALFAALLAVAGWRASRGLFAA